MTNKIVISTWFYSSPIGEKINYPQLGSHSDDWIFKKAYWDCIVSFFYSVKINFASSNEYKLVLFINDELPDQYEFSLKNYFNELNVEVIKFYPKHIPDQIKFPTFTSQFTMIDIFQEAEKLLNEDDLFLIFDSDCIFVDNIPDTKLIELNSVGVQFIKNNWVGEVESNGISNNSFNLSAGALLGKDLLKIEYFAGGEYFGFNSKTLSKFNKTASHIYNLNVNLKTPLMTEEQLFTVLLYEILNGAFSDASLFIKRIWTHPNYRTTNALTDSKLSILHLPIEKTRGFKNSQV